MISSNLPIILASKSPRRKKLLKQLGLKFITLSTDIDEEVPDAEHPIKTVKRLAAHKMASALLLNKQGIIITADTIVVLGNEIIGKPKSKADARRILKKLSGRTHKVYTGYMIKNSVTGKSESDYEMTKVTFNKLSSKLIDDYIKSGSPMDKAGAYGIQDDFGAVFIKKIDGCYYNVVGLPLSKFYRSLLKVID
jgi:septum formation protein